MRVAYLLGSLNRGGTETLMLDVCENLQPTDFEAIGVYRKSGVLEKNFLATQIPFYYLPTTKNKVRYIWKLRQLLLKHKVTIVHSHQPLDALYGYLACWGTGIKLFLTLHGFDFSASQKLHSFILKRTYRNIFVSEYVRKYYIRKYKLDEKRQLVVYNGINFDKIENVSLSNPLPTTIKREKITVGKVATSIGNVPKAIGTPPRVVGKDPKAIGSIPKVVGEVPRAIGTMPKDVGKVSTDRKTVPTDKMGLLQDEKDFIKDKKESVQAEKEYLQDKNNRPKTLKLAMVGNFVLGREQKTVCRFLKLLKDRGIAFDFYFVGKKNEATPYLYDDCVAFCKENKLEEVHFLGSRNDVPAILRELDAFIYSTEHDTFGIAVVEAIASSVPVFVNDWEVMKEVTEQGKWATLYKTKDENDLLEKFIVFLQNKTTKKWQEISCLAKKKYSIQQHIINLKKNYNEND